MTDKEIRATLLSLLPPGNGARSRTLFGGTCGVVVERQACRYRIGKRYAYCLSDATAILRSLTR